MKRALITLVFISITLLSLNAQEESNVSDNNNSVPKSSLLAPVITSQIISSEWVNDDFKIFISLPEYYDSLRAEKYPVVYFLDGGSPSFHNLTAELMQFQFIPDVITIGIGYPGATQRERDYTYGFMNFYQFLKQELIPQMDKEFNTDPMNRTLFGHSFGGICALFTMFQYVDYKDILFRNLIAASPSIWWPDGQLAYDRESSLYAQTHILPVNLYMTVGSFEGAMVTDLERMQQVLESRNYKYFNASYHINQNQDHSTNKDLTFREGIQWVFRQDIQIPTNTTILAQNSLETSIYPNPATDQINVVLPSTMNTEKINCRILNTMGKEMKAEEFEAVTQNNLQFSVAGFPQGIYIIQLSNGSYHQNLKFVKK